ncbi:hypothetical protein C8J55DRAFT_494019 [Lentinula edodes]|uniref:Uncharacterized protein n=1 Tax=Lentinula lateritia TaxID=40482 RepID=A0A9W9DD29_9AGAR|nr:hypothetical protein C8J55DRAFT_494019 [Lentinula edodes]
MTANVVEGERKGRTKQGTDDDEPQPSIEELTKRPASEQDHNHDRDHDTTTPPQPPTKKRRITTVPSLLPLKSNNEVESMVFESPCFGSQFLVVKGIMNGTSRLLLQCQIRNMSHLFFFGKGYSTLYNNTSSPYIRWKILMMVYMRVPKGAKSINKVPNWFGNKPQKTRHTWPKVWSLSLKEQNFIMVIVKLVKVMAKRNSIGSIQNNQLMGDPQRLCNSDCPLMSLTYRQESFKNSWTQTDGGIDEEIHNASFSRYLHISLRTKLLWHFVPTFLSVQGTVFEQAFLVHASAIWASHWPEDVTYGEKPVHERTALLKQAIYPSGFSRGDLDVEDLELHLGVDQYEARAIKCDKVAQTMLHHFFLDNILTYQ